MKTFQHGALILVFSLVAAGAAYFVHPNSPELVDSSIELSIHDALAMHDVQWIDARVESDFETAHHPGARLLNEERWEELLSVFMETWSPDVAVVVYCSSQSCARSHEVATRLREELGVDNVYSLKGGWEALQSR